MADGLRILLAASEVVGFAKTGGLADVAGSLPRALARRGHDCSVILPLYRACRNGKIPLHPTPHTLPVPLGHRVIAGRLWSARLPDSDVTAYLVEQPEFFERDDPSRGASFYQFTVASGLKRDYPDNAERFTFFCRAVLEAVNALNLRPDVVHANDWQTGLVPVYLAEAYRRRPGYDRIASLFTIHNIAYQGNFSPSVMALTGLDGRLFNHRQLEFYGQFNFLKAGVVFADHVSTVSPSYAREVRTPEYGCGLEGLLRERANRLSGIVNGVDYENWNPETDRRLAANYTPETVEDGKPVCKAALQRYYGLPERPRTPVLGMIARLVDQKGVDLVVQGADAFLSQGVQLVVLGEGDPHYHNELRRVRDRSPEQVGLSLTFDEPLAHAVEAGIDVFLMPSRYEPSGLNQLYSLKYGAVPVVRTTGGLADTITDTTDATLADGTATGFHFDGYSPQAFTAAVDRAIDLYRNRPEDWLRLVRAGMRQDWSWDRSAADYEDLYRRLAAERRAAPPAAAGAARNR